MVLAWSTHTSAIATVLYGADGACPEHTTAPSLLLVHGATPRHYGVTGNHHGHSPFLGC